MGIKEKVELGEEELKKLIQGQSAANANPKKTIEDEEELSAKDDGN